MKLSIQTVIWSLIAIAMVVVAFIALQPSPIEVETANAVIADLQVTVQEDGKTRIREKYVISAPVAGRLSRIEFKPGDEVCCDGSAIAIIHPADPSMLDARAKVQAEMRVEQARSVVQRSIANARQVQVKYDLAKANLERAENLRKTKAIPESEYDAAKTEYLSNVQSVRTAKFDSEIAEFEFKMAEAALLQFTDDTGQTPFEVSSPINGQVLRVFQESATVVGVGTPLIEIGDPQNLEMEIDVLSTDAVRIQPYSRVTVEHWGGQPLRGNVRVVEPAAFTKVSSLGVEEQRVNVIADFDESIQQLRALGDGYRIEAVITIEEMADVLQIPNSALFRYRRDWHVFKIQNDLAQMQPVEIGAQNETHTEIINGLAENDEIVVYPSDSIAEGSPIIRTVE
ncbi:MAG: HlyD family efflux transporter periplasmic adaptor subunit [Planctomycetota bacterium]